MEPYTEGTGESDAGNGAPKTATVVVPNCGGVETRDSSDCGTRVDWPPWVLTHSGSENRVQELPRSPNRTMYAPPPFVQKFVRAVAEVPGVQCIVIEDADTIHAAHITVFAVPLNDSTRTAIYDIEIETIRENPNTIFDFHLRRADEASGKKSLIAAGNHYFVVWGSIADAIQG